jgi:hypothetical protein
MLGLISMSNASNKKQYQTLDLEEFTLEWNVRHSQKKTIAFALIGHRDKQHQTTLIILATIRLVPVNTST